MCSSYPRIVLCIYTITCVGISARHYPLCPLAFRVLDLLQLGVDFGQCSEDLSPGFVLILQAVLPVGMPRPMLGKETFLYPFALHGFLQHCHHELGFLHEFVDQVGAFPWFHESAPLWLLAVQAPLLADAALPFQLLDLVQYFAHLGQTYLDSLPQIVFVL